MKYSGINIVAASTVNHFTFQVIWWDGFVTHATNVTSTMWTCQYCHSFPPSLHRNSGYSWLGKLSWCTPINIVEIRTDTSDHHEEATVLPISVCLKQYRETVSIEVWEVVLNCCKVSTCLLICIVGCTFDVWKVIQFTTIKSLFFCAWVCIVAMSKCTLRVFVVAFSFKIEH